MYNIYAIVILILFDIPLLTVNSLHQFQVAAAPRFPEVAESNWSLFGTSDNCEGLTCVRCVAAALCL